MPLGKKTKVLLIGSAITLILVVAWMYCHLELYCHLFPSIDTTFAKSYSEQEFDRIHPGMTQEEVQKLLGQPLSIVKHQDGSQTWWYSQDGRCKLGDFAWLGRSIQFKGTLVEKVEKRVYYD